MKAKEVFTPGRFPTVTFVGDHLAEKSNHLKSAIDSGGLIISLSGPSKSGKTVFVERELGKDNLIHITGAGVDSAEKLWDRVFDFIGTSTTEENTNSTSFTGTVGGKVGMAGGFLVKGTGELNAAGSWQTGETKKLAREKDPLQLVIKELKDSGFFLFIDDFHYVAESAKAEVAMQLKECIRQGVNVIVASVPYHSDDVIRSNNDLRGRMIKLDFSYWEGDVLTKIAQKGFGELSLKVEDSLIQRLAAEAAGSPQLMQALCLNLCYERGVEETLEVFDEVKDNGAFFKKVCKRTVLMADFTTTVSLMKEGPKTRGTIRHLHKTKLHGSIDVYPLVLKAIADDPPQLTFRYQAITDRIRAICEEDGPAGSSVTGACSHMARIANDSENVVVMEWDSEHDVLDVRDPYLLFYLRWAQLKKWHQSANQKRTAIKPTIRESPQNRCKYSEADGTTDYNAATHDPGRVMNLNEVPSAERPCDIACA